VCRREEFDFDEARSFGVYSGNLRALILLLKFGQRERLGQRLGELLAEVWRSGGRLARLDAPVVVVPVPLYPSRQRERGFNQAELLARAFARRRARHEGGEAPRLEARCLARTRPTAPQTGLSLEQRRENVRGVFAVVAAAPVRGRPVVLVDDVMTTGATLSAAAAALKAAGATWVTALTLARATPRFPDGLSHVPPHARVDELRPDST